MFKFLRRKSKLKSAFIVLLVPTLLLFFLVTAYRYSDHRVVLRVYHDVGLVSLAPNDTDISSSTTAASVTNISSSTSSSSTSPSSSTSSSSPVTHTDHTLNITNLNASNYVNSTNKSNISTSLIYPECNWPSTPENVVRSKFCSTYGKEYLDVCKCDNPVSIRFDVEPVPNNTVADIPVIVIASNRPKYLFRMLRSLCSTPGVDLSQVTVFIDGFHDEPTDVASLYGVKFVHNKPASAKQGRITQNYKNSITKTFNDYPNAKFTIILEEDLELAPDFFSYFSQTRRLLEEDSSIYCVSAWNDNGYEHASEDPSLLYRVEIMPGLGWMLSRKLFKDELERRWPRPSQLWHWDWWMRADNVRKDRDSIIPDVSRTYHFGEKGMNMNPKFQENYFARHKLNHEKNVVLKDIDLMKKDAYEVVIRALLKNATVLDHSKNPCDKDFVPDTTGMTYLMFIHIPDAKHKDCWKWLAKCLGLWDLDPRGFHKGLWRFWLKHNHILVMGSPYSPYTNTFKPHNITPIKLEKPKG